MLVLSKGTLKGQPPSWKGPTLTDPYWESGTPVIKVEQTPGLTVPFALGHVI